MKKKLIITLLFILTLMLAWAGGFFYFLQQTKVFAINTQITTDAVVVFGGNRKRIIEGTKLLQQGYAPLIFITGDKPREEYENFIRTKRLAIEQFIFDTKLANNKRNHAEDTALFLMKYKFDSIRLVVDADQMPRALREIKYAVPTDTIVIPHPIYRERKDFTSLMREYLKLSVALFASIFGKEDEIHLSYS